MAKVSRRIFIQGAGAALLAGPARAQSAPAFSALDFAESVGVNTHLSSEPYASRFPQVCDLLKQSGIRHVRDELRPTNNLGHWRELYARFGVRSQMLVSPATNTVTQMLDYLAALGPEKISAIEGQNEGDADWFMAHKTARGNWSETVVEYQRAVYEALRKRYITATMPVVSPTVIDWKPHDVYLLKGAAAFCDIVAIHSYLQHGEEPETDAPYAGLAWYLRQMRDPFKGGAPVMCTETGYNNIVKPGGSGVSETAAAIYIPRLLLNNFAAGLTKTFLYELIDGGSDPDDWESHWGLVRYDGTPKPVFYAISRLLEAMREKDGPATTGGVSFRSSFKESGSDGRLLQFHKSDGSVILALWRAVPCWSPGRAEDVKVPAVPLAITTGQPVKKGYIAIPNENAEWRELIAWGGTVEVPVGAMVVLVWLIPAAI
jgi:hypothetical protein